MLNRTPMERSHIARFRFCGQIWPQEADRSAVDGRLTRVAVNETTIFLNGDRFRLCAESHPTTNGFHRVKLYYNQQQWSTVGFFRELR